MTQSALMSHMLVHQAGMGGVPGGMQMSQQAYLALPSVESTMNRCPIVLLIFSVLFKKLVLKLYEQVSSLFEVLPEQPSL